MNWKKTSLMALLGLSLTLGIATGASAETRWEHNHPRRDQVIDRVQRQNHRITQERHEGDLTARQAHHLRVADRAIFRQEQHMAARNDGYITKAQQHKLNREVNRVSNHIPR